ncbi:HMCN2-like protein, partial [Mya arenaria]
SPDTIFLTRPLGSTLWWRPKLSRPFRHVLLGERWRYLVVYICNIERHVVRVYISIPDILHGDRKTNACTYNVFCHVLPSMFVHVVQIKRHGQLYGHTEPASGGESGGRILLLHGNEPRSKRIKKWTSNGPDNVHLSPSTTSYTVTEGNSIRAISCSATCNPACTYTWSRSGSTVSSTATLNLGQAVRGEAGSYVCTARHRGSNISRTGPAVNVNGPDHVSLSPSTTSYTVTEGHTLVPITCSAKCYPACTYTWSRSGVTVSSTATLNLHQAERAEAGTYVCTARNPILSVSRNGPDNASLSPSTTSYAVTEGNNIGAITCSATCYPACTYTWSRSGSTVSSTATLNLGQADRGEAGSYVCTARNPGSNISRNGPTVNINGPENVSLSPSKTSCTVNEGDIINAIMCSAMCYPACTYTWSRSGVTVSSTATLNLHQAERVEAGSYVCTARNPNGPDNVNLSPSTTSYTVTERDNIGAITCSATCNPACTYTWSRSGSTVSSSATLNFGQADRGEAGSYVCTSRNPGSNISRNGSEVNVNVRCKNICTLCVSSLLDGPSAVALSPSTLNYTKNDGDTLAPITCSADCFPACNISWRRISGISDIVSTNASFNLRELNRTGTGRYKCEAINPYTLTNTTSKDVTINVRCKCMH